MKKPFQGSFLLWVFVLVLSGCGSSQVGDSSQDKNLSSPSIISVGNPEGNPSGPYLVTSRAHEVFMSWTEEDRDGEGRNVLMAPVVNEGQQLGEIRQMNHEPSGSRGGEHKAKFTFTENDGVAALFVAFTEVYKHRVLKSTLADGGGPFSSELRLNDDQKEVSRANFTAINTAPDGRVYAAWLDGRNDLEAKEVFMSVSEDGGRSFSKNYPIYAAIARVCPVLYFLAIGKAHVYLHCDC